jgi:hypothetical protein
MAEDRGTWKRLGKNFVNDRCEDFGINEPCKRGKDPGPRWTASFYSLLGSPSLDFFDKQTLTLIGSRERTVELTLGRGTPCQANRALVKRLQQGHHMITHGQKFQCVGINSCFQVNKKKQLIHLIADATARTGVEMKHLWNIPPRQGDIVIGYWDYASCIGQVAVACAVFVQFPTGGIELVCMMTKKVTIQNDEEGDLLALRLLQDMLLHSQGISLRPEGGMMKL